MKHTNEALRSILSNEYGDYPQNACHYDREYKMMEKAYEIGKAESRLKERGIVIIGSENVNALASKFAHLNTGELPVLLADAEPMIVKKIELFADLQDPLVVSKGSKYHK